jgi:hypothetical protein
VRRASATLRQRQCWAGARPDLVFGFIDPRDLERNRAVLGFLGELVALPDRTPMAVLHGADAGLRGAFLHAIANALLSFCPEMRLRLIPYDALRSLVARRSPGRLMHSLAPLRALLLEDIRDPANEDEEDSVFLLLGALADLGKHIVTSSAALPGDWRLRTDYARRLVSSARWIKIESVSA